MLSNVSWYLACLCRFSKSGLKFKATGLLPPLLNFGSHEPRSKSWGIQFEFRNPKFQVPNQNFQLETPFQRWCPFSFRCRFNAQSCFEELFLCKGPNSLAQHMFYCLACLCILSLGWTRFCLRLLLGLKHAECDVWTKFRVFPTNLPHKERQCCSSCCSASPWLISFPRPSLITTYFKCSLNVLCVPFLSLVPKRKRSLLSSARSW